MIPQAHEPADRRWLANNIKTFPYRFRPHLARRYSGIFQMEGRRAANLTLLRLLDEAERDHINIRLAADDSEIIDKAAVLARRNALTYRERDGFRKILERSLRHISADYLPEVPDYAPPGHPDQPAGGGITKQQYQDRIAARLSCPKWWRRALRKQQGRAIERLGRNINLVNASTGLYATDETVKRRADQRSRNRQLLEELQAVNELGDRYTLAELSDLSVSNPAIRRGELMTRIAGFEAYARNRGHVAEFWTVTLPSKYHSALSTTGQPNPKYQGYTPRQGQKHLAKLWASVRSKYRREGIVPYGFRVCEPQHDGTPHWHLLLFFHPAEVERAREIMRDYALREDGNEPGAKKHRFTAVTMRAGGAAGYIAKYISKNIDGYGIEEDLFGKNPNSSAERVDAWASTWGIRQFQQIGGHPVTVWRELRRLTADQIDPRIAEHWAAADAGCWCAYLEAMDKNPIKAVLAWSDHPGRYDEPAGWQILGVELAGVVYVTRPHEWTIERSAQRAASWSPVNNCAAGAAGGNSNEHETGPPGPC